MMNVVKMVEQAGEGVRSKAAHLKHEHLLLATGKQNLNCVLQT